jgi:large subunit ribosomal protein L24
MGQNIKKNDTVLVITGREKGKRGRVLSIYPSNNRILIERINMIRKHMKPSKKYTQGGIIEKESPLHISDVMLICPKCNKPTKISSTLLQDGRKVRACKKCSEVMD